MEKSIGSIVREARKERGYSQKDVGALAKTSYTVVCHIEKDRFCYGESTLTRVASVLKLDINTLLKIRKHQYTTPQIQMQEMMCEMIDEWYGKWKNRIIDNDSPHRLGIAKEELKQMLCSPYDLTKQKIFDEIHEGILQNRLTNRS